jgi:hypothetical protein
MNAMGVATPADIDNLMTDYRAAETKRDAACHAGDDVQKRYFLERVEAMKKVALACAYVQNLKLPAGRKRSADVVVSVADTTIANQTGRCVGVLGLLEGTLSPPLAKCLADCRALRSRYMNPSAGCTREVAKYNQALDALAATMRGNKPGPNVVVDFNAGNEKLLRNSDAMLTQCDESELDIVARRGRALSDEAYAIAAYAAASEFNTRFPGAATFAAVDKFKACRSTSLVVASPDPRYAGYLQECTRWQQAAEKAMRAPDDAPGARRKK